MKNFTFTVDDNIRVFKEICVGNYGSLFDHPYFGMYKRLHERYGVKVQLNLFFECEGFCLAYMTDKYKAEWEAVSDWLKLSFHSRLENVRPYEFSGYAEVYADCSAVNREIIRFAGEKSLAKTTTVHYCLATEEGLKALSENGYIGLLGLYGTEAEPRSSYKSTEEECVIIRRGESVVSRGIAYAGIDVILNLHEKAEIIERLEKIVGRDVIKIMIHEQYFYPDYERYIPCFEELLSSSFELLTKHGYASDFYERLI